MRQDSLLNLSPLDGRYSDKISPLRFIFSEFGLIRHRFIIEIRWLKHLASHSAIGAISPLPSEKQKILDQWIENFSLDEAREIKQIEKKTLHDVKSLELWLARKFDKHGLKDYSSFIHFGCTSEDINSLAYGLMIKESRKILSDLLSQLINQLTDQAKDYAKIPMLARTHGQPASPTTLGKEFAVFVYRLSQRQKNLMNATISGKLNGATGNYSALHSAYPKVNWQKESQSFVENLGLVWNPYTTQIESHDFVAEILHQLVHINTILVDMCRDLWGYISLDYFEQKSGKNQVGSSTMPHKVNPINFENAEGNLLFAAAQCSYLAMKLPISRWQRDLSDSTLMRNLGVVFGHSLLGYDGCLKGLKSLRVAKEILAADLDDRWELLAEVMQTLLRRMGEKNAYQEVRKWSQGKSLSYNDYCLMVEQSRLGSKEKEYMRSLKPRDYTGLAAVLALGINKHKI